MQNKLKGRFSDFISNKKTYPVLTVFVAGLYPFLHYYGSNLSLADSWQQLLYLGFMCFGIPQLLLFVKPMVFKIKELQPLEKYSLTALNFLVFSVLLGILIFNFHKKATVLVILGATIVSFLLNKQLKKIVVIQGILGIMACFALVPRLNFLMNYKNTPWATLSQDELQTTFKKTPNIFVIQPDGYVNFSILKTAPYHFDNSKFESWMQEEAFQNYSDFRSNYYSTLTSNSSMFAMKHHFYANTDPKTLKTFKANNVIVGAENNVLEILKQNGYTSHLLTDNSYFLIDRSVSAYDYCNINADTISYFKSGNLYDVDIISDFKHILDTLNPVKNFFFIEKTVPSHIVNVKSRSEGKEKEKEKYLENLEVANAWLKELIIEINTFDNDALVVIVADHGSYVGLDYTKQVVFKETDSLVVTSVFSSLLNIKWPKEEASNGLKISSNVNLFRTIFYQLSDNKSLLENVEANTSYLPFQRGNDYIYVERINDKGQIVFKDVE